MKEIYQQTVEEVLERVNGKKSGLTSEQVKRSREKCGWNELTEGKKKGILQIFFEQYKDFLVLILIASAIISGMLGDVESAAVIVTVITINAILGTIQTVKAEQSLQSLKNLSGPEAKVLRDGTVVQIPARELVVGDVILLEAGDMIPADGYYLSGNNVKMDESKLTGESDQVEKGAKNPFIVSSTECHEGSLKMVVTAVGPNSVFGRMRSIIESGNDEDTPLQIKLAKLAQTLSVIGASVAGLTVIVMIVFGIVKFATGNGSTDDQGNPVWGM